MKLHLIETVSPLLLLIFVSMTSTCFITNCPIGGKRNMDDIKQSAVRQCSSCGPRGLGRCYGPGICCGSEMGCHINSGDSMVCQLENAYPVPCDNQGESCGESIDGKCAADGVCCSSEQCVVDDSCRYTQRQIALRRASGFPNSSILQIMKGKAPLGNSFK